MRIIGHGIDLVPVARIAKMIAEHGDHFLQRTFTTQEIADCDGNRRQAERLASRFAAKEAVLKAFGTGLRAGVALKDIGIVSDAMGKPSIVLANEAAAVAQRLGIREWHVSLTDTAEFSAASVIAMGE